MDWQRHSAGRICPALEDFLVIVNETYNLQTFSVIVSRRRLLSSLSPHELHRRDKLCEINDSLVITLQCYAVRIVTAY